MLAVNLGTRGPDAAARPRGLLPTSRGHRDRRPPRGEWPRRAARRPAWCLGNEMDGPWQIGPGGRAEYARLAREAARRDAAVDPTVELVACGSSGLHMPTFGAWERTVLDVAGDTIDHLSLHHYVDRARWPSVEGYLASSRGARHADRPSAAIVDEAARRRPAVDGSG